MHWNLTLFLIIMLQSSLLLDRSRQNSIVPGNTITGNQTIISAGGRFALGFFKPGNSTGNYYLGIWYHMIPSRTVVWIANRETPLDSPGVFTARSDGNLVVLDKTRRLMWSSNASVSGSAMNNASAVLMDTGNLVLRVGEAILWQSFDYPSDTILPGLNVSYQLKSHKEKRLTSWTNPEDPRSGLYSIGVEPRGNPQLIVRKQSEPYWRSSYNYGLGDACELISSKEGITFCITSGLDGDEMYIGYNITVTSSKQQFETRYWLDSNGQFKLMILMENSNYMLPIWEAPLTYCDIYGQCGPCGCCDQNQSPNSCKCLTGFEPKIPEEWDNGNWSGGCVRRKKLKCDKTDQFLRYEEVKLPDYSFPVGKMSLSDCESECRRNCSCTAYTLSSVYCLNWYGDLLDLTQNISTNGHDLYVRVHESELVGVSGEYGNYTSADGEADNFKGAKKWLLLVALPIVSIGLLTTIAGYIYRRKRLVTTGRREGSMMGITAGGGQTDIALVMFSFETMLVTTDNFSEANKLGEGGFGPVYKGNLPEKGEVAIKRLSKKSGQGSQEFMNELKLIAKLQHKNLVRLLGCCVEEEEKVLIYEYMPNGSLDKTLFDPSKKMNLQWSRRLQIIEGIAQGLLYLHKYSRLKVIHRDLKTSNILLDEEMNPKISDFGIARIFEMNQIEANTKRVVGTYGYMSPEYALYGQFSEKSDVFSFGVLLLEIVSGKKNIDFNCSEIYLTLLGWAWKEWREGRGLEIVDPAVRDTCRPFEAEKCIKISLLCVQELPMDRPTMSSIVLMLENQNVPLQSPKQPAFCTRIDTGAPCYSYDMGSMSMPEAR